MSISLISSPNQTASRIKKGERKGAKWVRSFNNNLISEKKLQAAVFSAEKGNCLANINKSKY